MRNLMVAIANLSFGSDSLSVGQWLRITLVASVLGATACSEVCSYEELLHPAPETTPFADGRTAFSACDACPMQAEGAATACFVSFNEDSPEAEVTCRYGVGGTVIYPENVSRVPGIANQFGFCEAHCKNSDLHFCFLTATARGVSDLTCAYGKHCD